MFAVMALVLALVMTGFTLGWTLAGQANRPPGGGGIEDTAAPGVQTSSADVEPGIPAEDVSGEDISGLPRYPGSVRVQYVRDDFDGVMWTEVEYATATELDDVREFYRDVFRTEGWSVGDVGFSNGTWTFFVINGEREVYVELEPQNTIVEVDFEMTEPERGDEPRKRTPKPRDQKPAPGYDDDYGEGNDDLEGGDD